MGSECLKHIPSSHNCTNQFRFERKGDICAMFSLSREWFGR